MAEHDTSAQALDAALARILRAVARVALRHGVSAKSCMERVKDSYVDAAMQDFVVEGRKPTISRAAVLTGLTRKEIQHRLESRRSADATGEERYNRAARVVAGWVRDADFTDGHGEPLTLPADGASNSFAELVRRYSGDMPSRAVYDELARVGAVESQADGRIRLLTRAYVPTTSDRDKLVILGVDVAALIDTIDHNLGHTGGEARFQRKVMYDNLPLEAIAGFRALSAERAQALLEHLDRFLAQHDRDVNPAVTGTGRVCAGMGIYYFEQAQAAAEPLATKREDP